MKQPTKPIGQPETPEAKAVRLLLATPGYAQAVERIDYLDHAGNVCDASVARAERYTLTDAGAAMHDEILAGLT